MATVTANAERPTTQAAAPSLPIARLAPLPTPLAGGALLDLPGGALLYAGGTGWNDTQKFWADRTFLYDPAKDAWSAGPALPHPLSNPVAVKAGDRWLLIGGEDGQGVSPAVIALDRDRNGQCSWREAGKTPFRLSYAAGAACQGVIYIVGGADKIAGYGDGDRSLWIADPNADGQLSWRRGPDFPGAADSLAAAASYQGRLYVFGGIHRNPADGAFASSNEAFAFNPDTGWARLKAMPHPLRAAVALQAKDGILLIGGWDQSARTEVWLYDPGRDDYRLLGELPQGMVASAGAAIGHSIYLAGNEDRPRHRSPDVLRITPPEHGRR